MTVTISSQIEAIDRLGFITHPGTVQDYLALLQTCVNTRSRTTINYHNQHTLYRYYHDAELREAMDASTVLIDGMGIVFLYKLLGLDVTRSHRITYVDFIRPLLAFATANQWRVFHVGQSQAVQQRALATLRTDIPGLQIRGHHGYFAGCAGEDRVLRAINDFAPQLLLVGMGTPTQECWIHRHRDVIDVPVVMSCGACMEYVAGDVGTPPRWLGRIGLEWSYRLVDQPGRFAYRYTIQTTRLVGLIIGKLLRERTARQTPN